MSHPNPLYDEYNDFYEDDMELNDYEDEFDDIDDYYDDNDYDDSMDGDHESGLASAAFGMDEDYNSDTPMYDDYYGGE